MVNSFGQMCKTNFSTDSSKLKIKKKEGLCEDGEQ